MLASVKELPLWPASVEPSLAHWKLNGPVPWAVVLKLMVSPGQLVSDTSASAVVGTLAMRLAKLVTLLQAPVTCTEKAPALAAVMLVSVKELPLWPGSVKPSLAHWKLNGPVPWGAVLKLTVSPGQLVSDTSASAVVGTLTMRLAKLVTLLQAPVTCTEKAPALAAVMLVSVKELPVWPGSVEPSLAHWKLNGPVPWGAVL